MPTKQVLKPCRECGACGAKVIPSKFGTLKHTWYFIACQACMYCSVSCRTKRAAIADWNGGTDVNH